VGELRGNCISRSETRTRGLDVVSRGQWYICETRRLFPSSVASGSGRAFRRFDERFFYARLALVKAHSIEDQEISPNQPSYPVVIMRAGGGALSADYTTVAEDLASYGYVVAGIDAPYRTSIVVLPDGRVITHPPQNDPDNWPPAQADSLINRLLPMWIDDIEFVLSQLERLNTANPSGRFTGRLDMTRLAIFGHSFGGAQVLQFCHDDAPCKAGIDVDGAPYGSVVRDGLKEPFMFLMSTTAMTRQMRQTTRLARICNPFTNVCRTEVTSSTAVNRADLLTPPTSARRTL
jgi:Platelet-activating factor acetylhydrolase, isoform II